MIPPAPIRPALGLMLLAPAVLTAQSLGGRVLDARTRTPIPSANVVLLDGAGNAVHRLTTDSAGRFLLRQAPSGEHRLRVSALGYSAEAGRTVRLGSTPVMLRILVEPTALAVDGITVTVERIDSHLRNKRQVIAGRVLDARNEEPVEAMDVVVRDVRGAAVRRTLSDEDGRFFTIVDQPGLYRLAVSRFGYDSTATAEVAVAPDQDLYIELRVQPVAFGVDPIRVSAPRVIPYLESTGFYSRQRIGQGEFLTPRDIKRIPGTYPSSLLRRLAGVTVTARGDVYVRGVSSLGGGACRPRIVLDGIPMMDSRLDDLVPMQTIEAMEVYKGPATVPPQWRGLGPCGVIAVWTKH